MTLLEVITKASTNQEPLGSQLDHPVILCPDDIFPNLKLQDENPSSMSLVSPVSGWEISQADAQLIDTGKKFCVKLNRMLKDTRNFDKRKFIGIFNPFLEKISEKVLILTGVNRSDNGYTRMLIEKIGFLMGRDVAGLVLEACVNLKIWDLVETLIVYALVDHSCYSNLVMKLVTEKRSDLICLCVKHAPDLGSAELLLILKYFLCPHKDAYGSMVRVREEWESQALLAMEKASLLAIEKARLLAIEKARGSKLSREESRVVKEAAVAKEAAVLLMVAHDGFSVSELCLHYLLASSNIDEVILASSLGKLNGKEMISLIRYLGKWLKKFEKFREAVPCREAPLKWGLSACDWVPKLEVIVKCLGLVLDENFTSLVLHPEFQEELRSIEGVVCSLALEARLGCPVANIVKNLRADDEGVQN